MLRFRCVHIEPKRAVLTYHGDEGETAKLEVSAPSGVLGDVFAEGAFYDVHIHPEQQDFVFRGVQGFHAQAHDEDADAGTVEREVEGDKAPEVAQPTPMPPAGEPQA